MSSPFFSPFGGTQNPSGAGGFSSQAGITGAAGLAGGALDIMGGMQEASASKDIATASGNIAGLDEQVNHQRQLQMNLNAQRQQVQNLRNVQRAKSAGLVAATSQGASTGGPGGGVSSGFAGGQGQAGAQGAYNALGISQNQQIGNAIFGLDDQIDQQKMNIASAQSKMAGGAGLSSIGKSVMGAAGNLGMLLAF